MPRVMSRLLFIGFVMLSGAAANAGGYWKWYEKAQAADQWNLLSHLKTSRKNAKDSAEGRCALRHRGPYYGFSHSMKIVSPAGEETIIDCADIRKKWGVDDKPLAKVNGKKPIW